MTEPVAKPHPFKDKLSVAPMMAWTDKHCRYFHRLISKNTLLYTEMVNAGAVIYGGTARHLDYNGEEHPVALQLGGNEPDKLAQATRFAQEWGYDEVNLNCGCPSPRVQKGAFGAALMAEPNLVADCVKAMLDVVKDAKQTPITVKHRIGIDKSEDTPQSYAFVRDFMGFVADAGCETFIVHARNAWLEGLSPKENRDIPPLRYDVAHRLKKDFPHLNIVINGGITSNEQIAQQLQWVDGVMLGREAYHNPWLMATWDTQFYGATAGNTLTREDIELQMVAYMEREKATHGTPWPAIARHMLGLRHGLRGARHWRQVWSNQNLRDWPPLQVMKLAHECNLETDVHRSVVSQA
ncbi:MAG TPA: tRNA dihydrouridine(20/20a) synthase DusA [Burkholderiaceae bacterium]|nr:tRNA dihydrouridine(20/20a) synthase DusA [Burkholderiaceae bacterium]